MCDKSYISEQHSHTPSMRHNDIGSIMSSSPSIIQSPKPSPGIQRGCQTDRPAQLSSVQGQPLDESNEPTVPYLSPRLVTKSIEQIKESTLTDTVTTVIRKARIAESSDEKPPRVKTLPKISLIDVAHRIKSDKPTHTFRSAAKQAHTSKCNGNRSGLNRNRSGLINTNVVQ